MWDGYKGRGFLISRATFALSKRCLLDYEQNIFCQKGFSISLFLSLLFMLTEATFSLFPVHCWCQNKWGHAPAFFFLIMTQWLSRIFVLFLACLTVIFFSRWVCSHTLQSCRWLWLLWSPCGCVVISDFSPSSSFTLHDPFKSHAVSLICTDTRFSAC